MFDLLIQSDQNLRGPRVARQQQLSIDIYFVPAPDSRRPPLLLSIDVTDGRTDGHTRPFYDVYR